MNLYCIITYRPSGIIMPITAVPNIIDDMAITDNENLEQS